MMESDVELILIFVLVVTTPRQRRQDNRQQERAKADGGSLADERRDSFLSPAF
jgi:hypothetical protein